ncbi:hypothetical protein KAU51_03940 [Candidatus Parcubacteria bacterium]|nr:hypothetical protein [Candidatus Parcubacteria bacterium]
MAIENEEKVEGENPDTKAPGEEVPGPKAEGETEGESVKPEDVAVDSVTDETDPDPVPVSDGQAPSSEEPPVLSYGEKMVGKSFNPGGDPKVDKIKTLCAEVIDLCNEPANLSSAKTELYKAAVTQMIIAQMCAVKFITFKN